MITTTNPRIGSVESTGSAETFAADPGTMAAPWPATNSLHTAIGVTAIRRFLRPLVCQNAPASVLPAELSDEEHTIPRHIDGTLGLPRG